MIRQELKKIVVYTFFLAILEQTLEVDGPHRQSAADREGAAHVRTARDEVDLPFALRAGDARAPLRADDPGRHVPAPRDVRLLARHLRTRDGGVLGTKFGDQLLR